MKQRKNTDFLVFSLFTLLTILTWTGLSVYRAFVHAKPPVVTAAQLLDIDPNLAEEVLATLEERKSYSEEEVNQLAGSVVTATPQPTAAPIASPTATLTPGI